MKGEVGGGGEMGWKGREEGEGKMIKMYVRVVTLDLPQSYIV